MTVTMFAVDIDRGRWSNEGNMRNSRGIVGVRTLPHDLLVRVNLLRKLPAPASFWNILWLPKVKGRSQRLRS